MTLTDRQYAYMAALVRGVATPAIAAKDLAALVDAGYLRQERDGYVLTTSGRAQLC